jgi:hypothetical protein
VRSSWLDLTGSAAAGLTDGCTRLARGLQDPGAASCGICGKTIYDTSQGRSRKKNERTGKQLSDANSYDSLAVESAFGKTSCSGVAGHGTANRLHRTDKAQQTVVD